MKREAFAAQRREQLLAADERLAPAIADGLGRWLSGDADWFDGVIETAAQVWLEHFEAENPGGNYTAAMRRFREALAESLGMTSEPAEVTDAQVGRITRWLSTYAINAGTVTGMYGRGIRYKMWTTMGDEDVRDIHRPLDGRVVPLGSTFDVAGSRLPYPAVPVGPPEVWIECRCVVMPASREGEAMSANTYTIGPDDNVEDDNPDIVVSNNLRASADLANPDGTPYTGALIVLVPADTDPVVAASSEPAHVTTVWFGEMADIDPDLLASIHLDVREYAADLDGPVVVPVSQRGTLGDDDADVVFLEPTDSLLALRDGLLSYGAGNVRKAYDAVEQFPEWTPHVTLGYPDRPARAEYDADSVTFDRLSLWLGGEHYDYQMGGAAVTAAATVVDDTVEDVTEPVMEVEDEPEDGEDLITEIPIHGVLAPEGILTGDGRGFREGALSSRPLPVPYRYEVVGSHGGNQTSEVVTVGRIDEAWRDEATKMWRFRGAIILDKPHASAAIAAIIDGSGTGVSIDADEMVQDLSDVLDADGNYIEKPFDLEEAGKGEEMWFSKTRVAGLTQVPIPAFYQAYVGLGHEFVEDMDEESLAASAKVDADCGCDGERVLAAAGVLATGVDSLSTSEGVLAMGADGQSSQVGTFAPGTKDGPGWVTHPVATSRIRRYWVRGEGAAKIGWGAPNDFYRCRNQLRKYVQNPDWLDGLCANMHKEATGTWPGQHDAHSIRQGLVAAGTLTGAPAPIATLVASASHRFPAVAFAEPADENRAFPMRIDRATRRISGYAAQWGVCHIGVMGMCQEPPKSLSNYQFFRKGIVETDQGEQSVGLLTFGTGHAGERVGAAAATAHYDKPDAVRAYINIGENQYGIWYAGVLAPWVTDDDIDAMLAIRRVSGDWRNWSGRYGDLEMVGLTVVNTEGFQLAASAALDGLEGGIQTAAIGIGAVPIDDEPIAAQTEGETHEQFVSRLATEVRRQMEFQTRLDAARKRVHALRVQDVRSRIEGI